MFGKKGTGQTNAAVEGSQQANVSSKRREQGETGPDLPNTGQSIIENNLPRRFIPQKLNVPARPPRIGYLSSLTNDHRIPSRFDNEDPQHRTPYITLRTKPHRPHDFKPIFLIPNQNIGTSAMLCSVPRPDGHHITPLLQEGPAGAQRRQHPGPLEPELPKDLGGR